MTIDGLNPLTTLTAGDELPVWDVEASAEEPTKKITAQNMAASVKTLGSLVNTTEMNNALAGKQNTLTFDTTPTAGSTNPVTSGGIANAIQQSTAWVKAGEATGTNTVSIPAAAKEILVYGLFGANKSYGFTWHAIRAHNYLPGNLLNGSYRTDTDHHFAYITINWNNNTVALGQWVYNVTDYTSTSDIYVYYR